MYGSDSVEQFGNTFTSTIQPTKALEGDTWFNPATRVLAVYVSGAWVATAGAGGGGGAGLPLATKQGQVLISGAAPVYDWAASDLDLGRY